MGTTTTRYALYKIDSSVDLVNVVTDFNNNWDAIDAKLGTQVCTLAALPSSPPNGMLAWAGDVNLLAVNDGTPGSPSWVNVNPTGDWVNVIWKGADPSGTNDSTSAIQAAINSLPATGGVVYFPAGTYKVTPTGSPAVGITLQGKKNIRLVGATNGGSTLKKAANGTLLQMSGTATGVANHCNFCTVEHLGLDGGSTFTGQLVQTYYADDLTFYNVYMNNNADVMLGTSELWDSRFINCVFGASGSTTANASTPGILLQNSAASSGFGLSTDSSNQIYFWGCRFEAFHTGGIWIQQGPGNVGGPNDIFLTDCKFETSVVNGGPHVLVDTNCRGVHLKHIYLYSGGFNGAYSTAQDLMTYSGQFGTIEDVLCANGGTATVANGITVNSPSAGCIVSVNNVRGTWGTAPTGALLNYGTQTGYTDAKNITANTGNIYAGNTPNVPYRSTVAATTTVANTVTRTAIQNHSVPANEPFNGTCYEMEGYGVFSVTGTPTLTYGLYWGGAGGTLLVASVAIGAAISGGSNTTYELEGIVNFRTPTSVMARLRVTFMTTATNSSNTYEYVTTAPVTVSSSAANNLSFTLTWGTASASNTLSNLGGYGRRTYPWS